MLHRLHPGGPPCTQHDGDDETLKEKFNGNREAIFAVEKKICLLKLTTTTTPSKLVFLIPAVLFLKYCNYFVFFSILYTYAHCILSNDMVFSLYSKLVHECWIILESCVKKTISFTIIFAKSCS